MLRALSFVLVRKSSFFALNHLTISLIEGFCNKSKEIAPNAKLQGVAADLRTASGVGELFDRLPEVDILVNNLGIYGSKAFEGIDDDVWINFLQINVISGVGLSRKYLRLMLIKNWGSIIFISSESAVKIPVEMIHYGS